jgi:superfamily II DNA helicase RecQ
MEDHDDFGLSSGDEAELLNLTVTAETGTNGGSNGVRKHVRSESDGIVLPPSKAMKMGNALDDPTVALELAEEILRTNFEISAFRLKQAQAITRVLNGESAVVVFPTGG